MITMEMPSQRYVMESEEESLRLDLKTDPEQVRRQVLWAGLETGMRVADLGCGPGKTTWVLHHLARPGGFAVGVDYSPQRISYARSHFACEGIEFVLQDIRGPVDNLGQFDFVWLRFVLEHYRSTAFQIVRNISLLVRPGGILCLGDLDHNCLNHFGIPERLEISLRKIMGLLQDTADFDPYAGRKLYAWMYDLGFKDIKIDICPHHLIFGQLKDSDAFNWRKKVEIAASYSGYPFDEYNGGYEEFLEEFNGYFQDPRRFTYTPLILCRGVKPSAAL